MTQAVTTQHVTITSPTGERLKKTLWSKPRMWRKSKDTMANLKQAVSYARDTLRKKQIGTIVYIGDAPVYHCKWGGGRGFAGWKNNPVADYWKRKVRT